MFDYLLLVTVLWVLAMADPLRADAFDQYINPVLNKVPRAEGAKELKQLTPELIADNDHVLPGITGALVVITTNGGRNSKLLVQAGRQKTSESASVPILLVDRYVTYREGQERTTQAAGRNITLFGGFHFSLDIGQVVPASIGGDLRCAVESGKIYAEALGKARIYLVTQALPEAAPKKTAKLVIGESFESRYFNGSYKLYDDGRRSGNLILQVGNDGDVTGAYYSDKDGQKYEVEGKIGPAKHAIQFSIQFPRSKQVFQGWMFTGDGKAIAGSSRLQERDTGFYAVRVEDP
jgi:hypothetical protein